MPIDHPNHDGWYLDGLKDPPEANIAEIVKHMESFGTVLDYDAVSDALHSHTMGVTASRDFKEKSTLAHFGNSADIERYESFAGHKGKMGEMAIFFAGAVASSRAKGLTGTRRPGLDLGGVRGQYGNWGALRGSSGLLEAVRTLPVNLQKAVSEADMTIRGMRTFGEKARRAHYRRYTMSTSIDRLMVDDRHTTALSQISRRIPLLDVTIENAGLEPVPLEIFMDSKFTVVHASLPETVKSRLDNQVKNIKTAQEWESIVIGKNSRIPNALGSLLEQEMTDFKEANVLGRIFIPESTHVAVTTAKPRARK